MLLRALFGRGLWLVLALILLGLVSNHCVLPASAETGAPHSHDEPASGPDHHAISAAPCDVVVAKTPTAAPVLVLYAQNLRLADAPCCEAEVPSAANLVADRAGPPLYVLHASLLI
jgi:hypothetical protein